MKKLVIVLAIAGAACSKQDGGSSGSAATGSGSAAVTGSAAATTPADPVEDVSCRDAANAYAKGMAATPGNVLSNAKPDSGLISWTALSMRDYCDGEPESNVIAWTPEERACVKAAPATAEGVTACFTGNARIQVNMGLEEVVTNALATQKKNAEEAAKAAGSAEKTQ
ncbi:MAG: hypothetical protein H0T89_37110 [Deltaproteobacteria bacterium]|nr:hypothetical protein [Deltaproteobacteria bacterium]MDQ3295232.1 hypothetical protein [Myxococcota bacterium]